MDDKTRRMTDTRTTDDNKDDKDDNKKRTMDEDKEYKGLQCNTQQSNRKNCG